MNKAPQPSPWGLVIVILFLVFLIWVGSTEKADANTATAWEHPQTCLLNQSDWPCLETEGC